MDFFTDLHISHTLLLLAALAVAFGFECVNGFHDTANAVATVIYTHSLRPWQAVVWSGLWNFAGVYAGGVAVAFTMLHLLPVSLLVEINTAGGLAMVLSLLGAAILWNFGTWYLGLPASSSHALIGAILGAGLMNSLLNGKGLGSGVKWEKAGEVGLTLLVSPLVGFGLAALLLLLARKLVRAPHLFDEPPIENRPPPLWIRSVLVGTCTGVSFFHGTNDGQKGMGLIMLILIGIVPADYALNMTYNETDIHKTLQAARELDEMLAKEGWPAAEAGLASQPGEEVNPRKLVAQIIQDLEKKSSFADIPSAERWKLRTALVELRDTLSRVEERLQEKLTEDRQMVLESLRTELNASVEYVPPWVTLGVALALGVGSMIGWKRIVITVGEKIGKTKLTYGQGACAELVAMSTIGMADYLGMPVSTTHALSSGVAGTMAANGSGIQMQTVRNIALAWILTLPASMLLAAIFFGISQMLFK